jgi:hypothetical protein
VKRVLIVTAVVVFAVALAGGIFWMVRGEAAADAVKVVFGNSDGLPEELVEGHAYRAAFVIGWSGPVALRDGRVSVFASRRGDTSEDAPEDGWPLVCESEFDDVIARVRLACPFVAPGPGEFALLLEVRSPSDKTLGETLYTHLVVEDSSAS